MQESLGGGTLPMQLEFLCTLYNYPFAYSYIKEYIGPNLFDEGLIQELASAIFESTQKSTPVDIDYFNNRYPEIKDQKIISTVFMKKDERYDENDLIRKMLTETIKRLNMIHIEKTLKMTSDITEVQRLLMRKKALDKLNIEFING